jgi:hypothetical protein
MIDAPRTVIFVHGVQWERNAILKGYSRPLAERIQQQAPSTRFRFTEVLWSDVVEGTERAIIQAGTLISVMNSPKLKEAAWRLLEQMFGRMHLPIDESDKEALFTRKISDQVAGEDDLKAKAFSAILDILLYESGAFKAPIQQTVIDALDACRQEAAPVLFGHSLGSVIAFDVVKRRASGSKRPPVFGLVTAGSPLGLLKRSPARPKSFSGMLKKKIDWLNFYDADDFLAFWNPLGKFGYAGYVQDRNINPSEIPFYSHIKYWDSSAIARELADLATTSE